MAKKKSTATTGDAVKDVLEPPKPIHSIPEQDNSVFRRVGNWKPSENSVQTSPPTVPILNYYPKGHYMEYNNRGVSSLNKDEEEETRGLSESDLSDKRRAAEVHRNVRKYAQSYIRPGMTMLEICEKLEKKTLELVGTNNDWSNYLDAGYGFPTGCSLNHVSAHYTPNNGDKTILQNGDICKLDFGVHVNGRIMDSAFTIAFDPIFDPELFGKQGKIMDSWETVRHNESDRDSLHLRLKAPGSAVFVRISTKFHDGNHPQFVRVLGRVGSDAPWQEIIPRLHMDGHSCRRIRLSTPTPPISEVLVEQYPDGGLTRLGLYSQLPESQSKDYVPLSESRCVRFKDEIPKVKKPLSIPYLPTAEEIADNIRGVSKDAIDYASAAFGGRVVAATNEHYGPAAQVISPLLPLNMFDGMESARSRDAGHFDEVTIRLGEVIKPGCIVLDFKYFVNNNPRAVEVLGYTDGAWKTIVDLTPVKAFAANKKVIRVNVDLKTDQIKVRTLPDGGINRVHVYE
jgi:allantoicase